MILTVIPSCLCIKGFLFLLVCFVVAAIVAVVDNDHRSQKCI